MAVGLQLGTFSPCSRRWHRNAGMKVSSLSDGIYQLLDCAKLYGRTPPIQDPELREIWWDEKDGSEYAKQQHGRRLSPFRGPSEDKPLLCRSLKVADRSALRLAIGMLRYYLVFTSSMGPGAFPVARISHSQDDLRGKGS
ncbi:hypothetical protein J3F83DRAFT_717269 [Trichoderma novae-zelandiae]